MDREWQKVIQVKAKAVPGDEEGNFTFRYDRVVGNGSFGIVCLVTDVPTGERLALKKVFQDRGYQARTGTSH